jgi:hypothetical protein
VISADVCSVTQRWRAHRDSYRPAGETIETSRYEVAAIAGDTVAKAFVLEHHYSGCYPAARYRFGLYRSGQLAGVAVFSTPCNDKALTNVFPGPVAASVELGRFVLLDDVPGNGETWFLARAFELLRAQDLVGVLSFSDPSARVNAEGATVFGGHVGTIYQAHNAVYLGRSTARTLRILPDGTVFSARAIQKIRARERGWEYAAAILERYGATRPAEDLGGWLKAWLPRLTRTQRHHGCHRYAWALERRLRGRLVDVARYPKRLDNPNTSAEDLCPVWP